MKKNVLILALVCFFATACGNGSGGGGSSSSNQAVPGCGDGIVQIQLNEECDDGNSINDDECSNECKIASCGDGIVQASNEETCDDMNDNEFDGCRSNCVAEYCGDKIVQYHLEEECDGGDRNGSLSYCTTSCKRRNNCVDGMECWVVHDANKGVCNVDENGVPDPRITRTFPMANWDLTPIYSTASFRGISWPSYQTDWEGVWIIFCPGIWKHPNRSVMIDKSVWAGYDPPYIPNISYQHQEEVYLPYMQGEPYANYNDESIDNLQREPTDTIFEPLSPSGQNAVLFMYGGSNNYSKKQYVRGIVFRGAHGNATIHYGRNGEGQTTEVAAGARLYCTNGVHFEDCVFEDNDNGAVVRDTDINWPFRSSFAHCLFRNNSNIGLYWRYGNENWANYNVFYKNNYAHMVIRDGKYHSVTGNTFGEHFKYSVRLEAVQYPADTANKGTTLWRNNFIGSMYEPAWPSFYDSCPSCGHWENNYWKWLPDPSSTDGELDIDPAPEEWHLIEEYYGC